MCRKKFGDSFTLTLAGPKMTFLFEPQHIEYFFSAPDEQVTFRPAVEQFTQRVFGLTSRLFFPLHFKMLTELRHLLVPSALSTHMQLLGSRALELLPCYVHHSQVDLYSLCRGLVFHCAVEVMFGRTCVDGLEQLTRRRRGRRAGDGDSDDEKDGEGEEVGASDGDCAAAGAGRESESEAGPGAGAWARALGAAPGGHAQSPPRPPEALERFARTFYTFEEGFELAASPVPHAFQPDFVRCRGELLRALAAADARGWFAGTPAGELLDRTTGLPAHLRPNLLLALLWASQANTVPAIFWSLAFLLLPENRGHKAAVVAELQAELHSGTAAKPTDVADASRAGPGEGASPAPGPAPARQAAGPAPAQLVAAAARLASSRRSLLSRCCAEALRLRVQSIDVRLAAAPLELPSAAAPGGRLRLPRGRVLAVCPFESHHDAKLYGAAGGGADPWVFDPNRPELRMGDGGAVVSGLAGLAFGGGPYRCPGRFLAEQELGLLVALMLASFDMQLSYGDAGERADADGTGTGAGTGAGAGSGAAQAPRGGAGGSAGSRPPREWARGGQSPPQPQLSAVQGGSLLYGLLAWVVGPAGLAWGFGWFDGLDGTLQDWRRSGDCACLLPPCDLRRLVGVKVPRKPCWVQLGRPPPEVRG